MAKYLVNEAGVQRCRELIEARRYVVRSDWGEVQPRAVQQNAFLDHHTWDEYVGVAPRAHRDRQGRDEGPVRVRVR